MDIDTINLSDERYAKAEYEAHQQWLSGKGRHRLDWFGQYFAKADLEGAVLRGADLRQAKLQDATLVDADLRGTSLWSVGLQRANLSGADLQGACLWGASIGGAKFGGANLTGAKLKGVHGLNDWIKCAQVGKHEISYTSEVIQIGDENHSIEAWKNFTDKDILEMSGRGNLFWWEESRDWLFATMELYPAKPTIGR